MRAVGGVSRGRRGAVRRRLGLAGLTAACAVLIGASSAVAAEPWGYEQVSPFDKGMGAVSAIDTYTTTRDGGSILYSAMGSFTEVPSVSIPLYNRYFATRGENRWNSRSTELPYDIDPNGITTSAQFAVMITVRASVNLKYALVISARALLPGAIEGGSNLYMEELATGDLKLVAAHSDNLWTRQSITHLGQTNYLWVGPDGDEALFYLPEEIEGVPKGYAKWTEAGGLQTAAFDEEGNPTDQLGPPGSYDNGPHEPLPAANALDHLYMSRNVLVPAYVMENDKAVPISVSQRAEDAGTAKNAEVIAVAEEGRYAFILVDGPLTDATPEAAGTNNLVLYRYDISDDSLDYIGYGAGAITSIEVIQATEDGETIAFTTSKGLLPGDTDAPSSGKNLYVWRNGTLQFVYQTEANSDLGKYMSSRTLHVLSRDGRYLYFTDNSKDLAAEFGTETNSLACATAKAPTVPLPCNQVYVYDADQGTSGELACASCTEGTATGHNGDPATGNSGYVRFNNHPSQYVSTDGRAFFGTATAFDPADTNGLVDVYEFHDGEHRLVSGAPEGSPARFIDASDDGKVVYFTSAAKLVPQDTDKAVDLYVTREGAGFPYVPDPTPPPCAGLESCHGPVPGVAPVPGASTSTFRGLPDATIVNGKVKITKARAGGRVATLTVRVSGPGKVIASGPQVRKTTKRAKRAGKVTLEVRLTGKGQAQLNRSGKLKRKLRVSFKPAEGRRASASRAVVFKARANKKGGR